LSPVRLLTIGRMVKSVTEKCLYIIDSDMCGNTYTVSVYICKLQVRLNRWVFNIGIRDDVQRKLVLGTAEPNILLSFSTC